MKFIRIRYLPTGGQKGFYALCPLCLSIGRRKAVLFIIKSLHRYPFCLHFGIAKTSLAKRRISHGNGYKLKRPPHQASPCLMAKGLRPCRNLRVYSVNSGGTACRDGGDKICSLTRLRSKHIESIPPTVEMLHIEKHTASGGYASYRKSR